MHHYGTVVAPTMPHCAEVSSTDMWRRVIPQMAFESEMVLSPVLALSALHIHSHDSHRSNMALAISHYLDKTLLHHRHALASSDGRLTEQLWLSAVLLTMLTWLLAHEAREGHQYELPSQAWRIREGISELYASRHSYLREIGYSWFGYDTAVHTLSNVELPRQCEQGFRAMEIEMLGLFQTCHFDTLNSGERHVYGEAGDYVLNIYRAYYAGVSASNLRALIGTMATKCRGSFLTLLTRHDPLAMAIMARRLVLLKGIEETWWMNGMGKYEVVEQTVRGMKSLLPKALLSLMDWPCSVLDGSIVLSRHERQPAEKGGYEHVSVGESTRARSLVAMLDSRLRR